MNSGRNIIIFTIGSALLAGCGARTKTASQVGSIFSTGSNALSTRLVDLCQSIRSRSEKPNMSGASMTDQECADAGLNADNYRSVKEKFSFVGLDNEISKVDGKDVLTIKTRAKIWLNSNIINMAVKLTNALQKRAEGGDDIFGKPDPAGGGDKLANLLKISVKELKKIEFNVAEKSFAGRLNISGEGIAKLNNDIDIDGTLFSDSVAVNVSTPSQTAFKDSILRDVNALAIVTPFAGDIYVDIRFEVNMHSVGLGSAIKTNLESALGSALKKGLDSLLKIE
jgi:hypothetical protein